MPAPLLRVYTDDGEVLRIGGHLLALAALFQLFDGIQTVATGALRGLGNTRTPMLMNLAGYWVFGLPLGYVLCFSRGYGIYGLWIGLSLALIVIAMYLLYSWQKHCPRTGGGSVKLQFRSSALFSKSVRSQKFPEHVDGVIHCREINTSVRNGKPGQAAGRLHLLSG